MLWEAKKIWNHSEKVVSHFAQYMLNTMWGCKYVQRYKHIAWTHKKSTIKCRKYTNPLIWLAHPGISAYDDLTIFPFWWRPSCGCFTTFNVKINTECIKSKAENWLHITNYIHVIICQHSPNSLSFQFSDVSLIVLDHDSLLLPSSPHKASPPTKM